MEEKKCEGEIEGTRIFYLSGVTRHRGGAGGVGEEMPKEGGGGVSMLWREVTRFSATCAKDFDG